MTTLSRTADTHRSASCYGNGDHIKEQLPKCSFLIESTHDIKTATFINYGQDDEIRIFGYVRHPIKTFFVWIGILLTAGFLRIFFHWFPHWFLKLTHSLSAFEHASKILVIEVFKKSHKSYHVTDLWTVTIDDVFNDKVVDSEKLATSGAKLNFNFGGGQFIYVDKLLMFEFKRLKYVWNETKHEFSPLRGLDFDIRVDHLGANFNSGLTEIDQIIRQKIYGKNTILVEEKSVMQLIGLEVLNPFYIFQIFSFLLWMADDYMYYALTILFVSSCSIASAVYQTQQNQIDLKNKCVCSDTVQIVRHTQSGVETTTGSCLRVTVSTETLVPGDIVVIPTHGCVMHCDAVLLVGNCIVNESMLTGESVPITKTPLPTNRSDELYSSNDHARHTLFSGTHVIQTRYFGDGLVMAVVIRTGFLTTKGALVRSILYPPPVDFQFEKDSLAFVKFLSVVASIGFVYTIVSKCLNGEPFRDYILEALDLITIVVPPALPAAMTVGRLHAQKRLKKKNIFCTLPRTINVAGSINCICFDKTGTLTEDGLDLMCVVPIEGQKFQQPPGGISQMPHSEFLYGMSSCHSLTFIHNKLTGDPLDLKMFEATGWVIEINETYDSLCPTVVKPAANTNIHPTEIGIIREFPFSSSTQRMGVIVRHLNGKHFEFFCKGSPEMLLNFVRKDTVPGNFYDVLDLYTKNGNRVIALAHKVLHKMSFAKVHKVHREELESDLTLLGLIVMENRLKPETMPCIQMLNEAKMKIIMVTGDNISTALSVAHDCDLITENLSIIRVECDFTTNKLYYRPTSIPSKKLFQPSVLNGDKEEPEYLKRRNYRFAIDGRVWDVLKQSYADLVPKIVSRGVVFARMSPDQKQQLIEELQHLGYAVAMCGDGANDCGALRAANVGISISESESSVASPFTSNMSNIMCVPAVIREGRAALVTSFGIFKYMVTYSLCQLVSVIILYSINANLSDIQYLYIDLFVISIFAFLFGRNKAHDGKLVKTAPLASLLSIIPIASLAVQSLLVVAFQLVSYWHLCVQDWFVPFDLENSSSDSKVMSHENYTIFIISSYQYVILAVIFSKGKPYREPIVKNYWFLLSAIGLASFSTYLALFEPINWLLVNFELEIPNDYQFRMYLFLYAIVNFFIAAILEWFILDYVIAKKWILTTSYISRRNYRLYDQVEKDLRSSDWPLLLQDSKKLLQLAKTSANDERFNCKCTTEIVKVEHLASNYGFHDLATPKHSDSIILEMEKF